MYKSKGRLSIYSRAGPTVALLFPRCYLVLFKVGRIFMRVSGLGKRPKIRYTARDGHLEAKNGYILGME